MKKILFIATIVALIVGTSVDANAKVKKGKRKAVAAKQTKSNNNKMVVDQGMWTVEGAHRLDNGDVANLEEAFIRGFFDEYVYTGNLYNDSYLRYIKIRFTSEALESLKNADGTYNWDLITGHGNITPENFSIKEVSPKYFLVEGGGHSCHIGVTGTEGSYKISKVEK